MLATASVPSFSQNRFSAFDATSSERPFQGFLNLQEQLPQQVADADILAKNAVSTGERVALASRLFNYALLGGTAQVPGSPFLGMFLGYQLDHRLDVMNQNSSPQNVQAALVLGTANVLKNFWLSDWMEQHPHHWVSRVVVLENILLNTPLRKKLLSDLWVGKGTSKERYGIQHLQYLKQRFFSHLSDPTIQRQTLGLKGITRSCQSFAETLTSPLKAFPKLHQSAKTMVTWGTEAMRGLPFSYRSYLGLEKPRTISTSKKLLHIAPGLLGDIALTSSLFYLGRLLTTPGKKEKT